MLASAELAEKWICGSVIDFLTQLLSPLLHRLDFTPARLCPEHIHCCLAQIKPTLPSLDPPASHGTGDGDTDWVSPSRAQGWGQVSAEQCGTSAGWELPVLLHWG